MVAVQDVRGNLVTLHVLYGDLAADRVPELEAIARWLAGCAERESGREKKPTARPCHRPSNPPDRD